MKQFIIYRYNTRSRYWEKQGPVIAEDKSQALELNKKDPATTNTTGTVIISEVGPEAERNLAFMISKNFQIKQ